DILTDLGAAISGSLGVAPGANINPERRHPSMFEPIHGSAPDIAGKGIANPIGAIWAGALMLDHLGQRALHDRLLAAIERAAERAIGELGWEAPASPTQLADRWAAELDRHGVSRAALIASVPGDTESVAEAIRRHPQRFVGFFMVDPTQADAEVAATEAID